MIILPPRRSSTRSRESPGGATLQLVIAIPEPNQIRRDAQGRDAQDNRELRAECFHRPVNPPASGAESVESKIPARLIGRSRPPRTRVRNRRIMDDELRRGTAVRALVVIEWARAVGASGHRWISFLMVLREPGSEVTHRGGGGHQRQRLGVGAEAVLARVALLDGKKEKDDRADERNCADQDPPTSMVGVMQPADQLGETGDRRGKEIPNRQADKVFEAGLAEQNCNREERQRNQRGDQLEHPVFPAPSAPAEHRIFSKALEIPVHNWVNLYHQPREVAAYNFEKVSLFVGSDKTNLLLRRPSWQLRTLSLTGSDD